MVGTFLIRRRNCDHFLQKNSTFLLPSRGSTSTTAKECIFFSSLWMIHGDEVGFHLNKCPQGSSMETMLLCFIFHYLAFPSLFLHIQPGRGFTSTTAREWIFPISSLSIIHGEHVGFHHPVIAPWIIHGVHVALLHLTLLTIPLALLTYTTLHGIYFNYC